VSDRPEIMVSRVPNSDKALGIHENAADAGCYTFLGETFIVDDEIDPALVQAIRAVDPKYVPLRVRRRYKSPAGSEEMHSYHVIGRYIEEPKDGFEHDYLDLQWVPPGFPFPRDKVQPLRTLWVRWKGPNEDYQGSPADPEFVRAEPPMPVKPDWWLVGQLAAVRKYFDTMISIDTETGDVSTRESMQDKLRLIRDAEDKRDEEVCRQATEEARYRMRHDWQKFKRAADEGRWFPEPKEKVGFLDLNLKGQE